MIDFQCFRWKINVWSGMSKYLITISKYLSTYSFLLSKIDKQKAMRKKLMNLIVRLSTFTCNVCTINRKNIDLYILRNPILIIFVYIEHNGLCLDLQYKKWILKFLLFFLFFLYTFLTGNNFYNKVIDH